jgi:hypothetical protein
MLLAVVFAIVAFNVYTMAAAPGKIDDGIEDAVDARGQVDVRVWFGFEPERYHILQLQKYGRVSGSDERSLELRATTQEEVRELARTYWIQRIEVLEEETWSP